MLVIQMLGGLHITLDGRPVNGFISSKAQALFCYLVLNRYQPPLRSALATLFWGDMPDEDAATNLRQAIANLKKLFEPYFDISRQSVAFRSDQPYAMDVESFEKTGDPQLYRGELLAGFGVPDAPEFDNWLAIERERLHHLALTLLHKQAVAYMDAGQPDLSIPLLNRLIAIDSLQEDAQRALMRALTMNGQRNAALAQYEICAAAVRRELNIEPEDSTTRLYERIRSARRFVHLPQELTPLIGRETELAELIQRLANTSCRLITLVGLGGMGKTRLALRLAHLHIHRMLHGVVMVDLTAVATTEGFLSALADALELKLSTDSSPRRQLLDVLGEKELLLILDNYEQLIGKADEFLSELLHTAQDLKLLITSRQRLNLHSEWVSILDGLPLEGESSALTLFWDTARRVRGDDLMTAQSESAVRRICQIVAGMPLAIELVAAWTRLLTCEELAEEIASNLTALETTQTDVEPRHRSLRAVFDHSWQLLSARDRRVLLGLSMFASGFTRDAAEQVAGASLSVLMGMADRMLIRRAADNRFSMHEMVRQFLAEKRNQSPEAAAIALMYIQYFVQFIQDRENMLKTSLQNRALKEITADIDNVHDVWTTALSQRNAPALLSMMPALSLYHDLTATWMIGETVFNASEPAFASTSPEVYGLWLSHMALLASRLDHVEEAVRLAETCLSILAARQAENVEAASRALMVRGIVEDTHGHHDKAEQYYCQALHLRETVGDTWGCANCYINLAGAWARQGDFSKARHLAETGLTLGESLGSPWLITRLQLVLGLIAEMNGELERATELLLANLATFEAQNNIEGRALTYNGLGLVALRQQNYESAQEYFSRALDLNRQLGVRQWEAHTTLRLGETLRGMGDKQAALHHFRESLKLYRLLGHDEQIGILEQEIAEMLHELR